LRPLHIVPVEKIKELEVEQVDNFVVPCV
jgi:hypothetical protein